MPAGLASQIRPSSRSSLRAVPSLAAAPFGAGPLLPALRVEGSDGPLTLSRPLAVDLIVYRGDTGMFRVTVQNADLTPHDVTDATWDADIRASADSSTVIVSMIVSPVPAEPESVDVSLTAAMSALLAEGAVYDVEMTQSGIVTTLVAGHIVLTKDVSRA